MKKLLLAIIISNLLSGCLFAQGHWQIFDKDSMGVHINPEIDTRVDWDLDLKFSQGAVNPNFLFKYDLYKQLFFEDENNNMFYIHNGTYHSLSNRVTSLDTINNSKLIYKLKKLNEENKVSIIKNAMNAEGGPDKVDIRNIFVDSKLNVWIKQGNTLYLFNENGWKSFNKSSGFPARKMKRIYENTKKDSTIWIIVSTDKYGINFKLFQYVEEDNAWLLHDSNTGFNENDCGSPKFDKEGNLWVTIDKKVGPKKGFAKYDGEAWSFYIEEEGIPGLPCGEFLLDKNNELWFTICNNNLKFKGIAHFDNENWEYYDTKDIGVKISIYFIEENENGDIWFIGSKDVLVFDGNDFKMMFSENNKALRGLNKAFKDSKGNKWIEHSSEIAINRNDSIFDLTKKLAYTREGVDPYSDIKILDSNFDIYEDSHGSIWLLRYELFAEHLDNITYEVTKLSYSGDILRYKDGNWKRFNLPDRTGLSIFEDSQGNIWLDSVEYIYKYSYQ